MRSFNRRKDSFDLSMPLGFKLWFGFILIMVLGVFAFVGYTFYSVASDPKGAARDIGQLVGEAQRGYEEAKQPKQEIVYLPEE